MQTRRRCLRRWKRRTSIETISGILFYFIYFFSLQCRFFRHSNSNIYAAIREYKTYIGSNEDTSQTENDQENDIKRFQKLKTKKYISEKKTKKRCVWVIFSLLAYKSFVCSFSFYIHIFLLCQAAVLFFYYYYYWRCFGCVYIYIKFFACFFSVSLALLLQVS